VSASYSNKWVFKSTTEQVANLMLLDENAPEPWTGEDLAAMVRHQMAATLEFDLSGLHLASAERRFAKECIARAKRTGLVTFGDLFRSSTPPLDLLRLSKKFFKGKAPDTSSGNPEQKLAYLFYVLSIVVAKMRTGARISNLTERQVLKAIESMLKRPWVDNEIRDWLAQGRNRISGACGAARPKW
jgi:hypothetical protein